MAEHVTDGKPGLDADVLARWLDANDAPGGGERPQLNQLKGGSQNTLYLVERGGQRMVLRMPGARADAARIDGLLREIRLVRALSGTDVPHAALIAADDTGSVLGMPFYVMQAIDGWSPMDGGWPSPFDTDLAARRGLAFQLVEGAARLGRVDWRARPGGLRPPRRIPRAPGRSLAGVSRRLQGARTAGPRRGIGLVAPQPPAHYRAGIMHGDYQFANVMFAHGSPARLAAIVDWEMTTVGDPLLDLAWCLLGYDGENPREDGFYLDMRGMPSRSELLEHYESVSGLSTENIDYYLVLANWKLGIVLEDVCRRRAHRESRPQDHRRIRADDSASHRHRRRPRPLVDHLGVAEMGYADQLFDLTDRVVLITGGSRGWDVRWRSARPAAARTW